MRLSVAFGLLLAATPLPAQFPPNEQSARQMRLERLVLPEFPPFLRQSGVMQGTVVVAIGQDARQLAAEVLVLESTDPRFTDAVLDAIREWKFRKPDTPSAPADEAVSVVRFLFSTGSVAVVPLDATGRTGTRRAIRADSPVELPNFSHCDETPRPLHAPAPDFPSVLRGRVEHGTAVVKYFVDPTGRVRLPSVISASEPEFGASAIDALRQWRFDIPRIDGQPVVVLERHAFSFEGSPRPPATPERKLPE